MALPTFKSVRARRREGNQEKDNRGQEDAPKTENGEVDTSDRTPTPTTGYQPGVDIKKATRARRVSVIISSFLFFVAFIFLILVIIGQVAQKPALTATWFFKLDLTNIFPQNIPDAILINSIARSLGLHDFYQVGLWNFCEGYNDEGITNCSTPIQLYWFNPVEIILNELLAGATIALPTQVTTILAIIKLASNLMFGFFITGLVTNLIAIFVAPLALYSRWLSLPLAIFTFITASLTAAATIIATVMFTIFKNVITSQADLNIGAELGPHMFGFMWTATACSLLGFGIQLCLSCCCATRRDVKTGKKRGSKHAYGDTNPVEPGGKIRGLRRRWFGRSKSAAADA